jgi:hypothetical protein
MVWVRVGVLLLLGLSFVTDVLFASSLLYASTTFFAGARGARRHLQHEGSVLALVLAARFLPSPFAIRFLRAQAVLFLFLPLLRRSSPLRTLYRLGTAGNVLGSLFCAAREMHLPMLAALLAYAVYLTSASRKAQPCCKNGGAGSDVCATICADLCARAEPAQCCPDIALEAICAAPALESVEFCGCGSADPACNFSAFGLELDAQEGARCLGLNLSSPDCADFSCAGIFTLGATLGSAIAIELTATQTPSKDGIQSAFTEYLNGVVMKTDVGLDVSGWVRSSLKTSISIKRGLSVAPPASWSAPPWVSRRASASATQRDSRRWALLPR